MLKSSTLKFKKYATCVCFGEALLVEAPAGGVVIWGEAKTFRFDRGEFLEEDERRGKTNVAI